MPFCGILIASVFAFTGYFRGYWYSGIKCSYLFIIINFYVPLTNWPAAPCIKLTVNKLIVNVDNVGSSDSSEPVFIREHVVQKEGTSRKSNKIRPCWILSEIDSSNEWSDNLWFQMKFVGTLYTSGTPINRSKWSSSIIRQEVRGSCLMQDMSWTTKRSTSTILKLHRMTASPDLTVGGIAHFFNVSMS